MPGRVTLVMGGGRGRWFVVLLVGCVIHPGPSLRYSPPVSTERQDRVALKTLSLAVVPRDPLEDVLTVVENEQDTLIGEVIAEQRDRPWCRAILQPAASCDRRSDVCTRWDLRQRHEIRAIGEVRAEIAGGAQRQSRLPDTAGPGEGHESRRAEASLDRSQLLATPHETVSSAGRFETRRESGDGRAGRA